MNSCVIEVSEGERKKGSERIFEEIVAETSLSWERKYPTKSRKCRGPGRINLRKNTLRHIVIKLTKTKAKNKVSKATRENNR